MEVTTIYVCEAHVAKLDEYHDFFSWFYSLGRFEDPKDAMETYDLACLNYTTEHNGSGRLAFKLVKIPIVTLKIPFADSTHYYDISKLEVDVKPRPQ